MRSVKTLNFLNSVVYEIEEDEVDSNGNKGERIIQLEVNLENG